jgi:mannosyltransferase OCH1-like enzyme
MIPKIIHQTWKTTDIPDEWRSAVHHCKTVNKGFEYILWTDETMDTFVKENYPNFYKIYKSYKYNIQRCDAFRYLVLYKYGGVYIDMDIVCKQNLNNFLHYDLVLAQSSNIETSFTNSFFMSIPNHPFFKYCIDNLGENVNSYQYFGKHLHVMNSTGPLFLNKMINNYGKMKDVYILTKKEFAGDCNICNETTCKGGTYFNHTQGGTWNEIDSRIYNFVLCNKKKILALILICLLIFILVRYRIIRRFMRLKM